MFELLIVAICLFLNAILAAYEMAFVSVARSELRSLAKAGNPSAKRLVALRENPERTLSVIQIGITLVGAIAAAIGGAGAGEKLEPLLIAQFGLRLEVAELISLLFVVVPITYLSVVFGELVPKSLALRSPLKIVLGGATSLFVLDKVLAPLIGLFEKSTQIVLKTFFPRSQTLPEENLTIELGELSPIHQKYVLNMADIETKTLKDILLPWSQVVTVNIDSSIEDVFSAVVQSGHTRLPVKQGEGVLGILHTKEFIALRESGESNWQSIIRSCVFLNPSDSALGAMRLLQEKKNHMAIVISSDPKIVGIITLEDIIEEIVGDIFDEDDDGRISKIHHSRIKARLISKQ